MYWYHWVAQSFVKLLCFYQGNSLDTYRSISSFDYVLLLLLFITVVVLVMNKLL